MGWYLPADNFCSEKRTVFRERSSRKTVKLRGTEIVQGKISAHISKSELVYSFYYSLKNVSYSVFGPKTLQSPTTTKITAIPCKYCLPENRFQFAVVNFGFVIKQSIIFANFALVSCQRANIEWHLPAAEGKYPVTWWESTNKNAFEFLSE